MPIRVALLMTNLDDLGVQRVVINLYNHFDRKKIEPILILWKYEGKVASFLNINEPVLETDHGIPWPRFFFRLFRYLKFIKQIKPDVILSFVPATNISVTLIKPFLSKKIGFIACEHAFITRAFETGEYRGMFLLLYRLLMSTTYNYMADALVMTAEAGKKDAIKNWGIGEKQVLVIYNPHDIKDLQNRAKEPLEDKWFNEQVPILIAAGRLTQQKGFGQLINAFSILVQKLPVKLAILGRGELEQKLKEQVSSLRLDNSVRFFGFQHNHLKYIKNSTVFVLSSVWEAMPMVLAETMAIGTPIVAFDCPSGPFEMLEGGKCGFLVEDQNVESLAATLEYAIRNPDESKLRAKMALASAKRFAVEKIVEQYENLIMQITTRRGQKKH